MRDIEDKATIYRCGQYMLPEVLPLPAIDIFIYILTVRPLKRLITAMEYSASNNYDLSYGT